MTLRQKSMGITKEGLYHAKRGEFLWDTDAFKAAMSMIKKGQYSFFELMKKIILRPTGDKELDAMTKELMWCDDVIKVKADEAKPYMRAVAYSDPKHFEFVETLGLDTVEVR